MFSGTIAHIIAKIIFVVVAYAIHMYLGKSLKPADYGQIGVVITLINTNYNFLTNGARQASSKALASGLYNEKDIVKKAFLTQAIVAGLLVMINYFGADKIAEILKAPNMVSHIREITLLIPLTAGYFICVGIINGYKMFLVEAGLITGYTLFRLSVIPYVGFVFADSASGTVMGFVTAAASAFVIGLIIVILKIPHMNSSRPKISTKLYLSNLNSFMVFFLLITTMLSIDMLFVNAGVKNQDYVGFYTGASNFAKVSYYLLTAIYLVSLPAITSKFSQKDIDGCNDTIRNLFMLILVFILPIVAIVAPTAGNMMSAFYTEEYRIAAGTTAVLMLSQFFIGMVVVFNVFILATKKQLFSVIIALIITIADALLLFLLVNNYSIFGAALATLISALVGAIVSCIRLMKVFKNIWSLQHTKVLVLNLLFTGAAFILSLVWITESFIQLLVVYAALYFLFLGICHFSRIANIKCLVKSLRK